MYKKLIFVLITAMMLCGVVSAAEENFRNFGNGVLFYGGDRNNFGSELSQYIVEYQNQHVVSIAPINVYGYTSGYYVVFENKTPANMICKP